MRNFSYGAIMRCRLEYIEYNKIELMFKTFFLDFSYDTTMRCRLECTEIKVMFKILFFLRLYLDATM